MMEYSPQAPHDGLGLHTLAGFSKANMEAAIARGQGISTTGAALECLTLEAIIPPSQAFVIDIETDNRMRALPEIRFLITKRKGNITPTGYLFTKRGVVTFEKHETVGLDEVLDDAIEAGAEDVETTEDGGLLVWTDPSRVTKTADLLAKNHGLKVSSSEIIWDANEDTTAPMESQEAALNLVDLVTALREHSDVQGIYTNATQGTVDDEIWSKLEEKLDA
jgi:transcriptional/translational regulatory protein YebC/TACO1